MIWLIFFNIFSLSRATANSVVCLATWKAVVSRYLMLTVRCLDLNEWRLAQGKGPFILRDTIRDMYGMRDVENIYRISTGLPENLGRDAGLKNPIGKPQNKH